VPRAPRDDHGFGRNDRSGGRLLGERRFEEAARLLFAAAGSGETAFREYLSDARKSEERDLAERETSLGERMMQILTSRI
jgi:hypothetical protein